MSRAWMPFYTGDFLADTMHLGATERGIYISLIIHCWQHGFIPREPRKLARISACDSRLWHQYEATVLQFFDVVDASTMQHRRVSTELRRYEELFNKRKAAAEQVHKRKRANAEHLHTQSQSQSQTKEAKASLGRARATRLEKDWWPSTADCEYAIAHGLSQDRLNTESEKFRNYWTAKAGQNAAKLDWHATWQNWVLKAAEGNGDGRGQQRETFDQRIKRLADKAREHEHAEGDRRKDDPFRGH